MKNEEYNLSLDVVFKNIDELKSFDKNPRIHPEEQIEKIVNSIKKYGFLKPIAINKDNVILSGHGRVEACKRLGKKTIPATVVEHLSDIEQSGFVIADNKVAADAEWDVDNLVHYFDRMKEEDFNLENTGFSMAELVDILPAPEIELFADEDDCPEVKKDSISKSGDVWLLGEHRLLCGDSTIGDDVQKLMGDCIADLLITDPPYNVSYVGKTKESLTINNDCMDDKSFAQFLTDCFVNAYAYLKGGGVLLYLARFKRGIQLYRCMYACRP